MKALDRLVGIGGTSLGGAADTLSVAHDSLARLYSAKNGFYAFETALLVRPHGSGTGSVEWWNHELGWKSAYSQLAPSAACFAEDLFGFQFVADESGFHSFDPETAERDFIGKSVDDWAAAILDDPDVLTGFPLGHDWQVANGPLRQGTRLAPATPFVLGGEYTVAALRAKPDAELASFRADIYTQIKSLPDGATVNIRLE